MLTQDNRRTKLIGIKTFLQIYYRSYEVKRFCEETNDFMDPQVQSAMQEDFSNSESDTPAIKKERPAPVIFQNCTFSNVQFVVRK